MMNQPKPYINHSEQLEEGLSSLEADLYSKCAVSHINKWLKSYNISRMGGHIEDRWGDSGMEMYMRPWAGSSWQLVVWDLSRVAAREEIDIRGGVKANNETLIYAKECRTLMKVLIGGKISWSRKWINTGEIGGSGSNTVQWKKGKKICQNLSKLSFHIMAHKENYTRDAYIIYIIKGFKDSDDIYLPKSHLERTQHQKQTASELRCQLCAGTV